jgi:hypothetical protein
MDLISSANVKSVDSKEINKVYKQLLIITIMYRVKKIKVLPLAYTIGAIQLLFGIIQAIVLIAAKKLPQLTFLQSPELASLTFQQILLYSVVAYAIGGFIFGLIIAWGYNYSTKWTGGIALTLKKDSK